MPTNIDAGGGPGHVTGLCPPSVKAIAHATLSRRERGSREGVLKARPTYVALSARTKLPWRPCDARIWAKAIARPGWP
jgi:hypothetical protein